MNKEICTPEFAYVGLGSNIGDRAGTMLLAMKKMMNGGLHIKRLSSIYETEPMDVLNQPFFLNMVAELSGPLPSPEQLLGLLLKIENELGRERHVSRGPRTIDLDLLLYNNQQLESEFLTVPHPRLHARRFVLVPLAEIAPGLIHPILCKTIRELLMEIEPDTSITKWQPETQK